MLFLPDFSTISQSSASGRKMIKGLYTKRGWYYWQPSQKGGVKINPIALKTKDQHIANQKVLDRIRAGEIDTSTKHALEAVISAYLDDKKTSSNHCSVTTDHTGKVLNRFCQHVSNPEMKDITRSVLEAYKKDLVKKDLATSSIQTYMRVIKLFLTWCVRKRIIHENPLADYVIGRAKKTRRQEVCTKEEQERLLTDVPNKELEMILYLGFYAGMRFNEMLAFQSDWLWVNNDWSQGTITVQETPFFKPKSREMRTIPLHPRLLKFLAIYGRQEPFMLAPFKKYWPEPPKYRFNPKKRFKSWTVACGIKKCTYHTLRHTFATQLAQKGASLVEIAQLLGDTLKVAEDHYIAYLPNSAATISKLE